VGRREPGSGQERAALAVLNDDRLRRYGHDEAITRSGNSFALVIDRPLREALAIDADTELEPSTDGDVLVVHPLATESARSAWLSSWPMRTSNRAGCSAD